MIIVNDAIYMVRGDDEVIEVSTVDSNGDEYVLGPNDVLTLTIRSAPKRESEIIFSVSSAPGSNRIIIRHENTAQMEYGAYSADIQLTTADGYRKTVWPPLTDSTSRLRSGNMRNFNIASEVTMI